MPVGNERFCKGIIRNFLWGGLDGYKKLAWIRWKTLCKPKEYGGLGLNDWNAFNRALLGKWWWKLMHDRQSLWSKVIRARYAIPWERHPVTRSHSPSAWWSDMLNASSLNLMVFAGLRLH